MRDPPPTIPLVRGRGSDSVFELHLQLVWVTPGLSCLRTEKKKVILPSPCYLPPWRLFIHSNSFCPGSCSSWSRVTKGVFHICHPACQCRLENLPGLSVKSLLKCLSFFIATVPHFEGALPLAEYNILPLWPLLPRGP